MSGDPRTTEPTGVRRHTGVWEDDRPWLTLWPGKWWEAYFTSVEECEALPFKEIEKRFLRSVSEACFTGGEEILIAVSTNGF
ncbi:hypothetical protein NDU88_004958 [Pleurodeles waltl]|uniref:Uncharacterized protein n=1 Tax=Pleurodeles waltl TaxID=8319 RepID=A0AAV7WVU1_PLEWA|nr:hypothetical protein NDU88_004958 [Pleurodeles waltl]